ncbi:MAG TPA: S8 family serine peptidase, partial [Ignavibacteria bacterium]|nr:S8 family serine peptidase [Ignavibacteria bacterium]
MQKIILLFISLFIFSETYSQQVQMTERLTQKLNSLNPLEYTGVLILLKDRVDIEALDKDLYTSSTGIEDRARIVITTLRNKAEQTQSPILNYLKTESSFGKVRKYNSYWITNMIYADATSEVIIKLSKRNDIDIMDYDAVLDFDRPYDEKPAPQHNTESVETGLRVVKADLLWALGFTGAGRTVMHIDTGVDVLHPALGPRWWGNNGRAWYHAWFDPISPFSTQPFDCQSHGTHTMGIMCGRNSASGDTVGVAPDARWMAAGITDCPGSSNPSMNIAAYQWAMDPDTNALTMDMPDVISCSWQDPSSSGDQCTNSIYRTVLSAVEAAGIAVVFSAGNSGPGASTITPPKNINIDSVNVFCVGNINGNSPGYPISNTSSRGPSICGGTGTLLIKPEVVAPGTSVRSTTPNNTYGNLSGTSMAAPHVAGCIALLKQAAPGLTGKQIKAILFSTAEDLGAAGEDNTYGKGLINVFAAFQNLGLYPLNNFNLQTPSSGITLTSFPNSNNSATITWDTSATGAQYKWVFGSPNTEPRLISIPSTTNSLTLTMGALDNLLASIGVNQGDSITGQWDVWAFRISPVDSMKAANGPRTITLKRGVPSLSSFNLSSPPSGTTITTS